MARAPMTLLCLGEVPWDESWKRNQSMAFELSGLAPFDQLIFVDPREIWIKEWLRQGFGRLWEHRPRRTHDRVWRVSLGRFLPLKERFPAGAALEEGLFGALIQRLLGGRPFVLLNNHPSFFSRALLDRWMQESQLNIFDLSDDFVEFYEDPSVRALYAENIERCCGGSDVVFAVNEYLRSKYGSLNPATVVVPNATNYENFHREQYQPIAWLDRLRAGGATILGHTGTINRVRVDYELLEQLLRARPDWQFVFVGGADPSFLEIVERHVNLHHRDQVPYGQLPDHVAYFDACVIPFRVNAHTLGNDLLKFNDYLAMGKPIVTTATGGAERYEELVWIARDGQDFLDRTEQALSEDPSDVIRERRRAMARENNWPRRAVDLRDLLLERLDAKGAS